MSFRQSQLWATQTPEVEIIKYIIIENRSSSIIGKIISILASSDTRGVQYLYILIPSMYIYLERILYVQIAPCV